MTLEELNSLCEKNNVPKDVTLLSDSGGGKCSETGIGGAHYSKELNVLVLTTDNEEYKGKGFMGQGIPKGTKFTLLK